MSGSIYGRVSRLIMGGHKRSGPHCEEKIRSKGGQRIRTFHRILQRTRLQNRRNARVEKGSGRLFLGHHASKEKKLRPSTTKKAVNSLATVLKRKALLQIGR